MQPLIEETRQNPANPGAMRAQLRRERLAARLAMAPAEHASASARLNGHLKALLNQLPPARIGFCAAIRGEFDATPLIRQLLACGWQACQPVVVQRHAAMQFRAWWPEAPMATDAYGIPTPQTGIVAPPDVLLVPVVGFDQQGYRLGYGGGYFDRTLAELASSGRLPLTIGLGFELARVDSVWPQAHDVPLARVVTEKGLVVAPGCGEPAKPGAGENRPSL